MSSHVPTQRGMGIQALRSPEAASGRAFATCIIRSPSAETPSVVRPAISSPFTGKRLKSPASGKRFTVGELLDGGNEGSFGYVHAGVMEVPGCPSKPVAIKIMRPDSGDPRIRERFEREGKWLASFNHPNILHCYAMLHTSETVFLVLELLQGQPLGRLLQPEGMPLDIGLAIEWASCVLDALHCIHTRNPPLIHRDLKPENLFVCSDIQTLKLLDFGIAKSPAASVSALTAQGTTMGTPEYMAPEQIGGDEPTPSTDLYALGAILYQMATGFVPFTSHETDPAQRARAILRQHLSSEPRPPRQLNPIIPPPLEIVILRLLAKEAHLRYTSASEVKATLQGLHITPALIPEDPESDTHA